MTVGASDNTLSAPYIGFSAEKTPMAWYVSYRTGGSTIMHMFTRRELAIAGARKLLSRGSCDALEVGLMRGTRKGKVLDRRDLQRIRDGIVRSTTPASAAGQK
jgi:hypothetical protein